MKKVVKDLLKGVVLTSILLVVYMMASSVALGEMASRTSAEEASTAMKGVLIMLLANVLILVAIVKMSRWRGPALIAGLTFAYYGVHTFVGQIEALAFLTDLGRVLGAGSAPVVEMPVAFIEAMFLIGLALAITGVPLTVLFFGRGKQKPEGARKAGMDAGQWAWKLGAVIVVYWLLYFGFGYYVAWSSEALRAFYQGADPGSFPAALWQNLVNTPLVYPWQALRALLWVAFTLPVIRMVGHRGWQGALVVAFFVALPMNLGHLVPNPFMPDAVRLAHFVETTSSNFLFGLFLFWLLHRAHRSPAALFDIETRRKDEIADSLQEEAA